MNYSTLLKYSFDFIISFLGFVFLSPLFLCIAIIIKIKMPDGPILFKQIRIGKEGKSFTIYKFRTMSNEKYDSTISVKGDIRITPFGAFLRRYKLDELPELWNVLKGDMSFVGPRPDVPGYADKLEGEARKILFLKPGITGPASLTYANEEEILAAVQEPIIYNDEIIFPHKVKINLDYYNNYSFCKDIKIIFQTILRKY